MEPFLKTDALVLREVRYKEADRILSLYTATDGKITAKARGALRKSSRTGAATQQLTYSEMNLFLSRGKYTVNEALIIEEFPGLRKDIESLALACYFAECIEAMTQENVPDSAVLQLALNSLYSLSNSLFSPLIIKAGFEMRFASLMGYAPDVSGCCICGEETPEVPYLGLESGQLCCGSCRNAGMGDAVRLCPASLSAVRYILSAPSKQIFSFSLEKEPLARLGRACEDYLARHAERHFPTLDYWKSIKT